MKTPPIDWEDLLHMGVSKSAIISSAGNVVSVEPPPPPIVRKLLAAAAINEPPSGDRMAYLRHVRDLLVNLTDWTQASDAPLTIGQQAAWAAYRQSLRDLPATYAGDGPIPWPEAPA